MAQNSKVLTREADPISLISTGAATMEGCPVVAEKRIPVSTTEQRWTLQVVERIPVGDIIPERVNPLPKIANWLSRLGSGRINEGRLESRQNIDYNPRIRGIGL
jgi:hypothetical protein